MKFRFKVLGYNGKPDELARSLRQILSNIQVAFTIEDSSPQTLTVEICDSSSAEERFIVRVLQRSGYDLEIEE